MPATFTTTDKVILREYQKEKKDVILYTSTCKQRLSRQCCYCCPFPPHPVSSLSKCLQVNLVPVNSLNQHATKPAGQPCIFTWELTGRKETLLNIAYSVNETQYLVNIKRPTAIIWSCCSVPIVIRNQNFNTAYRSHAQFLNCNLTITVKTLTDLDIFNTYKR